jgi:hypothetical protein
VQARYKINCLKMLMKASFQHISNHLILHMYLENRIQKKDTISLTQKIQDIREKTKIFVNTNKPKPTLATLGKQ